MPLRHAALAMPRGAQYLGGLRMLLDDLTMQIASVTAMKGYVVLADREGEIFVDGDASTDREVWLKGWCDRHPDATVKDWLFVPVSEADAPPRPAKSKH